MYSVPLTDSELAFLAQLLKSNTTVKRLSGIIDTGAEKLLNKMVFSAMACKPGGRLYLEIGGQEMDKTPDTIPDKKEDGIPGWIDAALNEHLLAIDLHDPISPDEAAWMLRELASSDMDYPAEFLRRTA